MDVEALFTRSVCIAEVIGRLLGSASRSVGAALYRLDNPQLANALERAARRGVRVRLVVDRGKYEASPATQELLSKGRIGFRLLRGRKRAASKMHHKFVLVDDRVLTGSYNWTLESEEENYENLLILRDSELLKAYQREFEALWARSRERRAG